MQPLQDGITHPLCTANWLGFEANNYSVTLIMLPDIAWNLLTKIVHTTLLIEIWGTRFVYHIVYPHWLLQIKWLQINWVAQLEHSKWCGRGVGLRYFDAPLPMEMRCHSQFTWRWLTVNARRCFSICFTVMRNLLVIERREKKSWMK